MVEDEGVTRLDLRVGEVVIDFLVLMVLLDVIFVSLNEVEDFFVTVLLLLEKSICFTGRGFFPSKDTLLELVVEEEEEEGVDCFLDDGGSISLDNNA